MRTDREAGIQATAIVMQTNKIIQGAETPVISLETRRNADREEISAVKQAAETSHKNYAKKVRLAGKRHRHSNSTKIDLTKVKSEVLVRPDIFYTRTTRRPIMHSLWIQAARAIIRASQATTQLLNNYQEVHLTLIKTAGRWMTKCLIPQRGPTTQKGE